MGRRRAAGRTPHSLRLGGLLLNGLGCGCDGLRWRREKSPQGPEQSVAMSALPIIVSQNSPSVGCFILY